jgi:hypothetical protein
MMTGEASLSLLYSHFLRKALPFYLSPSPILKGALERKMEIMIDREKMIEREGLLEVRDGTWGWSKWEGLCQLALNTP